MRTLHGCAALVATVALCVRATWGGEIAGKLETVNGKTLTIASESNIPPRPGDPVEVYFEFPDEGPVLVAKGVVDKIGGGRITAEVTNLVGTLAKGQLVRIERRATRRMIVRPGCDRSQVRPARGRTSRI